MNSKLIRLTESDLHRIVKESVHKIINEIGDTEGGQDALGQVHGRAIARAAKLGDKGAVSRKLRNTARDAAHKAYSEADKNNLFAGIGSSFDNGISTGYHKAKTNESRINRVVKESVNRVLNEVQFGGESLHGNNPEDWMKVSRARKRNALDALNGDEEYHADDERAPYLNKNYRASSRDEINAGRICVDKFVKLRPGVYRYNDLYASQANKVFNRGMGSLAFVNFLIDEKTILVNKVLANKKDIELIKNNFPEWKIEFVSLGYPDWYDIKNLKACRGK